VPLSHRAMLVMFACYVAISLAGASPSTPPWILGRCRARRRARRRRPAAGRGGLAHAPASSCAARWRSSPWGRLIERYPPHLLFASVATVQLAAVVWAGYATGAALIAALALALGGIYAQVTVAVTFVIARYTADAWRGRVYSVRYFLTFITSGIAVQLIAQLYSRGGFDWCWRRSR